MKRCSINKLLINLIIVISFPFCDLCGVEEQEAIASFPELCHTAEPFRLRQIYEEAILNAKRSICIFTFSFSDAGLIQLINQKAEEGVDVWIVIDKDHQNSLLSFGSNKLRTATRTSGEGRVHHKILMVDDELIWLGSANFSAAAFTSQENLSVGLKSIPFAKALREEAEVFFGERKRTERPLPIERFNDQEAALYILPHFDPRHDGPEKAMNEEGRNELQSLIGAATSRTRIAMMVWTDPILKQAVLDAHRRGVIVEVLLQDMQDTVSRNLENAGVFVTVNPNLHFMHNKWMWVDEGTLVNGSANWSRSSFSRNDESFLVIKNLNEDQRVYLEEYWNSLINR